MSRLIQKNRIYTLYEYSREEEFEKDVIVNAKDIFGPKSIYINLKKRIGNEGILSIPDGYLVDFSFENDPRLFIVENELVIHDPYRHIGQQLLKFAISYKASGRAIKSFLLETIMKERESREIAEAGLAKAGYRNIDDALEHMIFEKTVQALIVIDQITSDLENVVNQLTMKIDIIEVQKFMHDRDVIFKFTPFQEEIRSLSEASRPKMKIEDLDTIVVPANEDGFKEVFLGEDCWWAIRISASMIDRIKYIAAYQTAPVSAITYYAPVAKIEKYKDSGKYIVYFQGQAKKVGPVKLSTKKKGGCSSSTTLYHFPTVKEG